MQGRQGDLSNEQPTSRVGLSAGQEQLHHTQHESACSRGILTKGGAWSGGVASGSDLLHAPDLLAFDDDSVEGVKTANEPGGDKDFWAEYGSGGEMMDC